MNAEQIRSLDAMLASQIGDDVSAICDHESLFKQARVALQAALTAMAENEALQARVKALEALVSWAYDTLIEINPGNYSHDDVCRLNDASVEVILGLDDTVQALLSKGSPDADA
jgi:hypothetical protein